MKMRIQGNVLRFRLNRAEVARLSSEGTVSASLPFPDGHTLSYRIEAAPTDVVQSSFRDGEILLRLPAQAVREWSSGEQVGIEQTSGPLEILIEKDFQCMHKGEEGKDPDAYPNPMATQGA